MSVASREAELILHELRDRVEEEVKQVIQRAVHDLEAAIPNKVASESKTASSLKVDKVLMEALTKEIEDQVVPMVDDIMSRAERSISAKMALIERDVAVRADLESSLEAKLRLLEDKLHQLSGVLTSAAPQAISRNPYVDIEEAVKAGNWDTAWRRAVQVYNGVDFAVHLIHPECTMEDFFSLNPIQDPLLSLQVCINTCQELLQSEKELDAKIDLVSELVLNLTNPGRMSLAHQFIQLKDLLRQLSGKTNPSRFKEILKIVAATERLLTPAESVESTPARHYPPPSPSPMYP